MAKKTLSSYKNPLTTTSGSVFDLGTWLGGIMWVVMFGMIVAIGSTLLGKVDKVIPGSQTPNMKPYTQTVDAGPGYTVL